MFFQHHIAFHLVAPDIPAGGRAAGKELQPGNIPQQGLNAPPCFLRLLAVFLHRGNDDLVDVLRPPLGMAFDKVE